MYTYVAIDITIMQTILSILVAFIIHSCVPAALTKHFLSVPFLVIVKSIPFSKTFCCCLHSMHVSACFCLSDPDGCLANCYSHYSIMFTAFMFVCIFVLRYMS